MAIVLDGTTGEQLSGNLTFTSTGQRITGDFSNATQANRTLFQSSTTNGQTNIGVLGNGTSGIATFQAFGTTTNDPANSSYAALQCNSGSNSSFLYSAATGSGTPLPLNIFVGTTTQMTIATDGTITGTKGNLQLISGTAVASTSGTSIDFTGIPSWAKRVTVMFNGVSTSGSSYPLVQIGTGGTPTTSGYVSQGSQTYSAVGTSTSTIGFYINMNSATYTFSGTMTIYNVSGNIWVENVILGSTVSSVMTYGSGTVTLGGVLNMVRITTTNGTDTFDAGSINIMYE